LDPETGSVFSRLATAKLQRRQVPCRFLKIADHTPLTGQEKQLQTQKKIANFFASDITFAIKFIIIDDHMLSGRSYETYPSGLPLIG
jgi:hypothetical protein